jgi:hypothetical protein
LFSLGWNVRPRTAGSRLLTRASLGQQRSRL